MKRLTTIMKTTLTMLLLSLIAFTTSAQTSKGSWTVGGGASLRFDNSNVTGDLSGSDQSMSSFSISPSAGYFVTDGLAIGTSVTYSTFSRDSDDGVFESSGNSVSFGPFIQYYHESGVFVSVGAGIGRSNSDSEVNGMDFENNSSFRRAGVALGYAIFLNDHISLEPAVSYSSFSTDPDTDEGDGRFVDNTLNFSIGFNLFLTKD